jgi:hypothetical protein
MLEGGDVQGYEIRLVILAVLEAARARRHPAPLGEILALTHLNLRPVHALAEHSLSPVAAAS